MISRDGIIERKDALLARREELAERAQEIRERFAESVTQDAIITVAGWTVVGAGVALGATLLARGKRGIWTWVASLGLVAGGLALVGNGFMSRRSVRISEAEMAVREQLAALDPVARWTVMRDIGKETMPFVHHTTN